MFTESPHYEVPPEEQLNRESMPSRFGDKERILDIMEHCDESKIERLGSIDELYSRTTPSHTNVVEVVKIPPIEQRNANSIVPLIIHDPEEGDIQCIFKPWSGESRAVKRKLTLQQLYPQEAQVYEISEAFGFDLVPPTTIRQIGQENGSLQLFIDPNEYIASSFVTDNLEGEEYENFIDILLQSRDFYLMALLDFIAINPDRNPDNYMARIQHTPAGIKPLIDENAGIPLIGLDHGPCLSLPEYSSIYDSIKGPSFTLTYENPVNTEFDSLQRPLQQGKPKNIPISNEYLALLEKGYSEKRRNLSDKLRTRGAPDHEVSYLWQRTKALLHEKRFLSRKNIKSLPDAATAGELTPHPPFVRS